MAVTDTVEALIQDLAPRAEASLKTALGAGWNKLSAEAKADAKAAGLDLAKLALDQLRGKDVAKEIAFCEASIADVASKVADLEGDAMRAAIISIVGDIGAALGAFARGSAKGLLGV